MGRTDSIREEKDRLASASAFEHCTHSHPILVAREARQGRRGQKAGNRKPMRFVSLHHHSTFSYLDGYALPEAHIRRATELNMSALALTEHGNISSHVKLEIAAQGSGVKPIYGCEIYYGGISPDDRTQRKNHLTVLAGDAIGYANLMRLVSRSWAEGFYYEPTVSWDMLRAHSQGLIILSGCTGSELFTSMVGGKLVHPDDASYKRARAVARRFARAFPGRYYIEVQAFPELEQTRRANPMLARLARELRLPLVATMDCHYTVYEEAELQKILHNIRPGEKKTLEEQVRDWGYDVPLCPPPNDKSIYRRLRATGLDHAQALEAVLNTELIAQDCNVVLPKLPMVRFPLADGVDSVEHWRAELAAGWRYRGCHRLRPSERARYQAQLDRELEVIESKGFADYFLVVADAVRWAKDNQILVGPARGSAAASLACWLLRITEVNPMLFPDLVFERFIDVSRADLPDIDLDFDSDRRHEVREYLVSRYGAEQVSNIGTFGYFKSKLALDDVARVHQIPKFEIETIKGLLVERSSGDLRASATIEDTFGQFEEAGEVLSRYPELVHAMDLEGNVKQFGVHAAGLVVSNGPITDVTAVLERVVNGHRIDVVSMDKYDAERQGLLKLDFLGLSTMAMLAEACRLMDWPIERLYRIPLDDPATARGFYENDLVGVFQFDGMATRILSRGLKPDTFKEVCDVNALSRPGPLHNGAASAYINVKNGTAEPELLHPIYDEITRTTHHQLVYQEQILRVVRELGGFDWTSASAIRRIMSKKSGEAAFNREWERFWAGAQERGVDRAVAEKIWGLCITAGAYAFNAAHSTSYGMIAWWTMWLKRHHPEVFYAASLAKMPNTAATKGAVAVGLDRHSTLRADAVAHGLRVLPPNPRRPTMNWTHRRGALRAGLTQIPGIGEKVAARMLEVPARTWADYIVVPGVGPKTIQRIEEFCAQDDPFNLNRVGKVLAAARALVVGAGLPAPTHTAEELPYSEGADVSCTWIGIPTHLNLRDIFESARARTGKELNRDEVRDPHLNEFMVVRGYDGTETLNLRFTRWVYPQFRDALWKLRLGRDVVYVRGVKPGYRAAREIYVREMHVIEPDEEDA